MIDDTYFPPPSDEDAPPADPYAGDAPPADPHAGEGAAGGHADPWADPVTGVVTDDDPSDPLLKVAQAVAALQDNVEALQQRLDQIEDDIRAAPDGPWNWANLTAEARKKLWVRLYAWVSWLEDRYLRNLFPDRGLIPELPADWYRHPVAVEMLTALMVAHAAAYRKKAAAPSFALVEWHERCLWPTLARLDALKLWSREDAARDWNGPDSRPTRRNDDRFMEWVAADAAPSEQAPPAAGGKAAAA